MKFRVDQDLNTPDGWSDGRDGVPGVEGGTRVRLSWITWEGLACVVVLAALCIVFGGDEPVEDAGAITLSGHSGLVETVRFSPDGETLVTSCYDKTIRLWEVGDRPELPHQLLASLPGEFEIYTAVYSPGGGTIAVAGLRGLTIWNWRDPLSFPKAKAQFGPCRALVFAPDGRSLAVGGFDGRIHIWDPETDRVLAVLDGLVGRRDGIRALAFAPDGSMLVSQDFSGVLKFWDLRNRREVDVLDGRNDNVHTMCLAPDGRTLALSRLGTGSQIEIWDLESKAIKTVCTGHLAGVHTLGFSPDGRTLVSAGGDRVLRFWDTETGKTKGRLKESVGWVRSLDISRDGRWLAYSGSYNKVYLKRINLPPAPAPTS